MIIFACVIVNNIQVCKMYEVTFYFIIDTVDDEMVVSFRYACKRERLLCEWLIDTFHYNPYKVSILFVLNCQRWVIQMFYETFLESVQMCLFIRRALPKTRKPNVFWILLPDQSAMNFITFFEHVWQTVCIYSSMHFQLKRVGSDKLLNSVLWSNYYLCNI